MRIVIVAIAIILAACSTELFQPQAEIPTASYKAVWINASWSGGRTGTPLSQTAESPPQWFGALCRANLLTLENHPDNFVFANTLTANNTCTIPIVVGWCVTAGGNWPGEPTCAKDPRETPENN